MLSSELATHLTGRYIPTTVLTFSFHEYIQAKKADLNQLTTHEQETLLLEYLRLGGYPETVTKKLDSDQYLSVLFDSIIYKDIIKRHKSEKAPT